MKYTIAGAHGVAKIYLEPHVLRRFAEYLSEGLRLAYFPFVYLIVKYHLSSTSYRFHPVTSTHHGYLFRLSVRDPSQ